MIDFKKLMDPVYAEERRRDREEAERLLEAENQRIDNQLETLENCGEALTESEARFVRSFRRQRQLIPTGSDKQLSWLASLYAKYVTAALPAATGKEPTAPTPESELSPRYTFGARQR